MTSPYDDEPAQVDGLGIQEPRQLSQPRPAPPGLRRRDRKAWQNLELERFNRETTEAAAAARQQKAGWQQGFLSNPPHGLGRKGRRAWLAAEREQTRRWWTHRRASNQDIDARAVGVLVIALLLGGAMIWGILTSGSRNGDQNASAAKGAATSSQRAPLIVLEPSVVPAPQIGTASPANSSSPPRITSLGVPTAVAPLAGHWEPAPAGGVTPVPATTASTPGPRTVALQPAPTAPIQAADLITPVAAVTTWLARTCPSTWTDDYGDNLRHGQAAMTTAGWAQDDPGTDTAGERIWTKVVVAARQTRACGDLHVSVSSDAPTAGGTTFVGYTADRVVTAPGVQAVVEHLVGARIVVRQSDGRWLVDRAVVGG